MLKKYIFVFLAFSLLLNIQHSNGRNNPVLHEVSNKDIVQKLYPEATKVEKINDFWFKIIDEKNQILGFAMSSAPYCKNIIGYNNTTPVMIITNKEWIIQKISLLTNYETLFYVRRLERKGYFNLWDGKTLSEAKKIELDAYSGATLTAKAVSKNVEYLLENGSKVLPKN